MKTQLESIVINPKRAAKASVIWMHGLGADGYDFIDIVPQLALSEYLGVRFVFPHAPVRPVTRAGGCLMNAWFDLGVDLNGPQDERGIRDSQALIEELIAQELSQGIANRRIVLAGFSQGGAMAMQCGLRYPEPLAGVLSLSGFLTLADTLEAEKNIVNQNTPILMIHGAQDALVRASWAQANYEYLTKVGFNVKLQIYDMEHTICAQEIAAIAEWLTEVFDSHYPIC